jgi:hypothetical protein
MRSSRIVRGAALLLAVAAAQALHADVLIVDQFGGPGSHFTDIPPAVAAAKVDDVIVVRKGTYSHVHLFKGLTVIARPGVVIQAPTGTPKLLVQSLPAGQVAALVDFEFAGVVLRANAGTVVVDSVQSYVFVDDCADVRVRGVDASNTLYVEGLGRTEVVQSSFVGFPGSFEGYPGIDVRKGAFVHVARSSSLGGYGYDDPVMPGYGGHSVWVQDAGSRVLLLGRPTDLIQGGPGGFNTVSLEQAEGGNALVTPFGGAIEWGGATLLGGKAFGVPYYHTANVTPIAPTEPTLAMTGTPTAGASVDFSLTARDGSQVVVLYGRKPALVADSARVERLVAPSDLALGGRVTGGNRMDWSYKLPASAQPGDRFFVQAQVMLPSGKLARSNSVPVIVR